MILRVVVFCGEIAQRVDVWYAISILSQQKSPIGKAKNDPCPMLQWEAGASYSTPAILTRPPLHLGLTISQHHDQSQEPTRLSMMSHAVWRAHQSTPV